MEQIAPAKKFDKHDESEMSQTSGLLDIPETTVECIIERLSATELANMVGVCSYLRAKCKSNHLWERHLKLRWGSLLSPAVYRAWQSFLASSSAGDASVSAMSLYFGLETGKFWFPAQVYYRENWHVSFVLSCYDAHLSYNSKNKTFQAWYPPHGKRAAEIENGVEWERVRPPPVDISPHQFYLSDSLSDLYPGDHIEVQWRRNKVSPYGWWYGVVGHLEICNSNANHCECHSSDNVVLEFKQYASGTRWRRASVSRNGHTKEEGSRRDGFYGGIRKLNSCQETATWKRIWPAHILALE